MFGRPGSALVRSPGRINLIGEHIDYLDGWVMPVAIERYIYAAAAAVDCPVVRILSAGAGDSIAEISLDDLSKRSPENEQWLNYVIGVLAGYRGAGVDLPGFDAVLSSNLPGGAGLSSSAALETAIALLIESLTGVTQDRVERALVCQKAEQDFAGVPCGIMDQLAVGISEPGRALKIDCLDLTFSSIALPDDATLVIADTGVTHALADGEYRRRREDCEQAAEILGVASLRDAPLTQVVSQRDALGDRLLRRARHAVTEMARVHQFSIALEANDVAAIGRIMREGHDSLRDDFDVSCEELDSLVDAASDFGHQRGLLGARMTGGGFGGSTVNLVHRDAAGDLIHYLKDSFSKHHGRQLHAFETSAGAAARILISPKSHQSPMPHQL